MRVFTTACLIATVLVFACWGALLHPPPASAPIAVRKQFAQEFLALTAAQLITIVGAGVGAALIVRQARKEYRDVAMANMQALIEAAKHQNRPEENE